MERTEQSMATTTLETQIVGPTTPEAFLEDRQGFWISFTHFIIAGVSLVVLILVLLALFLL